MGLFLGGSVFTISHIERYVLRLGSTKSIILLIFLPIGSSIGIEEAERVKSLVVKTGFDTKGRYKVHIKNYGNRLTKGWNIPLLLLYPAAERASFSVRPSNNNCLTLLLARFFPLHHLHLSISDARQMSTSQETMTLLDLPVELVVQISEFLTSVDLVCLALCNHALMNILNHFNGPLADYYPRRIDWPRRYNKFEREEFPNETLS